MSTTYTGRPRRRHRGVYLRGFILLLWAALMGFVLGLYIGRGQAPEPTAEALPEPAAPVVIQTVARVALPAPEPVENEPPYSEEELELLALVIYQEAGGDACSDETRLMVGNVALNRVEDDRYPDTLEEVLTQRAQYGRLHWTGVKWPDRAADPEEANAVERAYDTARRLLEGERLLAADVVFQAEFPQGTETVAHQDGLYFCR